MPEAEQNQSTEPEIVAGPPSKQKAQEAEQDMSVGVIDSEEELDEFEPRFGAGGILSGVSEFQEEHPFIFFGTITVIIFLIIFGIVSLFIGGDETEQIERGQVEEPESTIPDDIPEGGAIDAIKIGIQYSDQTAYSEYISENIKLADGVLDSEEAQKFLVNELITIKKLEDVLAIDVQELLGNSGDRATAYEEYLDSLIELEQRASQNYGDLLRTHEVFQNRFMETNAERENAYARLNNNLVNGTEKQIAEAIVDYSEALENTAKIQARDGLVREIVDASLEPIILARARIGGMKANREILVQGLEVVDIDNSGLDLIKSGELDNYYQVPPGLEIDTANYGTTNGSNLPLGDLPVPKVKILGF